MTRRALCLLLFLTAAACGGGGGGASAPTDGLTVALMPKNKGNPYFVSCRQGAEEAAKELYIRALKELPPDIKHGFDRLVAAETDAGAKRIAIAYTSASSAFEPYLAASVAARFRK